jgi:hypothetical protein
MSNNVKTKSKTNVKVTTKKPQSFVRINIDDKLENILIKYGNDYPLLGRAEIVKMLLSRAIKMEEMINA